MRAFVECKDERFLIQPTSCVLHFKGIALVGPIQTLKQQH